MQVQIGVTAERNEQGEFLAPVPIFSEADEQSLISDIAKVFAGAMKQYIEGMSV